MKQIKINFFGDSTCVGQNVALHKGWIPRLSAALEDVAQKQGFEAIVTNTSANGRTTRQALEAMPYEIQSNHPHILIVQFGLNDCNYWESDQGVPRVSPNAFKANLEEIIARAFVFGTKVVFLNTNHPTGRDKTKMPYTNITFQQSNREYNRIICQVANQNNEKVILNNIEKEFYDFAEGDQEKILKLLIPEPDLLHVNEAGHQLYYKVVYRTLVESVLSLANADKL